MATNKDFIVKNGLSVGGDVAVTGNVTSDLHLNDNAKIKIGSASNGDLQIYHTTSGSDANNSFIEDIGTGSLYLRADTSVRIQSYGDNNDMIKADKAGAVTLYHNNGARLATTASGISVPGTASINEVSVQSELFLGSSSNGKLTQSGSSWLFHTYASGAFGERFRILDTGANVTGNLGTTTLSSGNITTTGYLRGPSTFTIDPATHADNTGTVVIAGNLTVDGTQTTINSTTLTVDDKNIVLASGAADAAAANGAGITVDGASATLLYASSGDKFAFNKSLDITGNATVSGEVRTTNVNTASSSGVLALYGGATNPGGKIVLSGGNNTGATGSGIAFHAGSSTANPAERMRILSGGNVGIGTDGPSTLLTVSKTASDHTSAAISIENAQNGGYGGILNFVSTRAGTQVTAATIGTDGMENWSDVASTSSNLKFSTINDGTLAERMRIHSSGKVGIGETGIPDALLHLKGGTATGNKSHILFENTQGSKVFAVGGGADGISNSHLFFRNVTDNTRPMVISDAGSVGIGTDSPFAKSHIKDTGWSSAAPYGTVQLIEGNDVNDANWGHLVITDTTTTNGNGGAISFATGASTALNPFSGIKGVSEGASWGGIGFYSRPQSGTATRRMTITSSGNVGIGTNSPSSLLELRETTAGLITGGTGKTGPVLTLHHEAQWENGYTGGDWLGAIDFSTGDASVGEGVRASIRTTVNNYYNTHALAFYTANQGDTTLDERMRIKENGLVGIGTQSPLAKLHVRGTASDTRLLLEMDGDDVGGEAKLQFKVDSQDADTRIKAAIIFQREDPGTRGTGNLHFAVEGTNSDTNATTTHSRIMIQSDGKVGIGTTAPIEKLHVTGQLISTGSNSTSATAGAERAIMDLSAFSATDHSARLGHFRGTNSAGAGQLRLYTDSVERVRIDKDGQVGIGSTDPKRPLQIGATGSFPISFNGNYPDIHFNTYYESGWRIHTAGFGAKTTFNGATGHFGYSNVASTQSAAANFTPIERFTILANGNVGIGAPSPSSKLHVQTETSDTNTAVPSIMITNLSSGTTTTGFGGEIRFQAERNNGVNQNTGGIRSIAEVNSGSTISSGLAFDTGTAGINSEKMRITNTGIVDIGKAAFGSAPTGSKFNVYGNGEVFRLDGSGGTSRTFRFRNVSTANPAIITADGSLEIGTEDANTSIGLMSMRDIVYKTTKTNSTAGHHKFFSYNTEIVRIDGQYNRVGIMQTSPEIPLDIEPDGSKRIFGSQQNNTQHGFCEYLISGTIGANAVTITMQCSSYWQAEVTATFQQSNGGSDNNVYFNGIWSNNHTTHLFKNKTNGGTVPQIGSMGVTPTFSVGVGDAASNTGKLTFTKPALANSSGTYTVRVVAYGYGSRDMTYVVS